MSTEAPEILLSHYLKTLKLPTFQREYQKLARLCATEGVDHVEYLTRLAEREMIERDRRKVERRIKAARFPVVKSLDSFEFTAIPKLNKMQVLELARCEWIARRENVIMPEACLRHDALGPSGTGKTHIALGLGLAACQKGMPVSFTTAAALLNELMEARDERRLLRLHKPLAAVKLLIILSHGLQGKPLPGSGRVGLRAALQDRCRAAVRADLAAPRARFHADHQQSALRGMDRNPWH